MIPTTSPLMLRAISGSISHGNNSALKYTGPFKKSGTLSPATTVTNGLDEPSGIALDASGDLYISNFASSGSNSIAVFTAPIVES